MILYKKASKNNKKRKEGEIMTTHRAVTFALMNIMVMRGQMSLRHMKAMARDPMKVNERLLKKIIRSNRGTVFGKEHHFDQIRSLADYRQNVPASAYEDYAAYIERTKKGEKNVLTSKRILGYSRTSGSAGARPRRGGTEAAGQALSPRTRALSLPCHKRQAPGRAAVQQHRRDRRGTVRGGLSLRACAAAAQAL